MISGLKPVFMLHCPYWSVDVEPTMHSWNESNLVMMDDLPNMSVIWFCKYFVGNFCNCVCVRNFVYSFLFVVVMSLPGFGIRVTL